MTLRQHDSEGNGNGHGRCKACGGANLVPTTRDLHYTDKHGRVFSVPQVDALECPDCGRLSFTLEMADQYSRKIRRVVTEQSFAAVSQ